jgi:hypothetical protein
MVCAELFGSVQNFSGPAAFTENDSDRAELAGRAPAGATVCGDAERQRSGAAGTP